MPLAPILAQPACGNSAAQGIQDPYRTNRMNREPLSAALGKQAQLTIAIQFDLNSARIRPNRSEVLG